MKEEEKGLNKYVCNGEICKLSERILGKNNLAVVTDFFTDAMSCNCFFHGIQHSLHSLTNALI